MQPEAAGIFLLSLFIYCHFNKPGEGFNYCKRVREGWDRQSDGQAFSPNPTLHRARQRSRSREKNGVLSDREQCGTAPAAVRPHVLGACAVPVPCPTGRSSASVLRTGSVFVYPCPGGSEAPVPVSGDFLCTI